MSRDFIIPRFSTKGGRMDLKTIKRSYYAVIPANVRYDERLPMGARFLYGEITALCNEKGYCWASNKYFADLYKVTDRTVRSWISSLITNGYIISDLIFKENSKEVEARYLKLMDGSMDETPGKNLPTPTEENFHTYGNNLPEPMEENFLDNNTSNNTEEYITISKDIVVGQPQQKKTKKFIKPTIEEINAYCLERKNNIDAGHFFDYYESKGWKIGKNPMKDWKAAVRTWERQEFNKDGKNNASDKRNGQQSDDRYSRAKGWF